MLYLRRQIAARLNDLLKSIDVKEMLIYIGDCKVNKLFHDLNTGDHLEQYGIRYISGQGNRPYSHLKYIHGSIDAHCQISFEQIYAKLPDNAKKAFDKAIEDMYD